MGDDSHFDSLGLRHCTNDVYDVLKGLTIPQQAWNALKYRSNIYSTIIIKYYI